MARLISSGFEQQVIDTGAASRAEGQGYQCQGAATIETTVVRSGAASFKVAGVGSYVAWQAVGQALARNYYWRFYVRFPTAPSANALVARVFDSTTTAICSVRLSTGRLIALLNAAGTNIGSSSTALAVDTWHCIEVRVKVPASGSGELQLHVNDVAVANNTSTATGNAAPDNWTLGQLSGTVASLYYDDVALNDDQGSDQNTRPGAGKIVLLKPISDSSRTGWTDGNGGTSNLYQAVDNIPPVGEATSGTTATSQVEDADNNATDTYVANLQTYTTGGIAATDVITLAQALATIANGASITPARQAGIQQSSNPSGSETVANTTPSVAAGTYPTGWTTVRDAVLYLPSVTLGSSPQLTLRKATVSTDVLACAALGLYVEFRSPIIVAVGQATETDTANAVTPLKTRSAAQTTETDAAQATTSRKTVAVGQATETDTAQAVVFASGAQVRQATETDSAQAVTVLKTVAVGQAGETDLAQTVTQAGVVGQALETDVAQPITVVTTGGVVSDGGGWAMPVKFPRKHQFLPVLGVQERDTALPIGVVQGLPPRLRYVPRVKESNVALPIGAVQTPSLIQIEDDELLLIL